MTTHHSRQEVTICWLRRDLRLTDHPALSKALQSGKPVVPVFVFDKNILKQLPSKEDARVQFIRDVLIELQEELVAMGSSLDVYYDTPLNMFKDLIRKYAVTAVYCSQDYEPYARERDAEIETFLSSHNIPFYSCKDHVIFEKDEVVKDDGTPYTIFTPYSRRWKALLDENPITVHKTAAKSEHFFKQHPLRIPSLKAIGFEETAVKIPGRQVSISLLEHYAERRDYPGIHGTSHIGIHLRFGTVSIRALAKKALEHSEVYLNELIWRDFYQMVLWHFPQVGRGYAFKPEYDHIRWRYHENDFERWRNGQTGYPIVDAGMRELNTTGYMHNRVRMITASFLAKHLLIDWRWGEAWFAEKLLDFELGSNNGGWQWVAGSGCDAAPYFRIFNPNLQAKKFDKDLVYVRKWVPEIDSSSYPAPMVEHEFARKRCLEAYKKALNRK